MTKFNIQITSFATSFRRVVRFDPDARQRGVDTNAKNAGNAHRFHPTKTTPHHREVVSRGHQAFMRPSDGCANTEISTAGLYYPADACRPPSSRFGVGARPTRWIALPPWQPDRVIILRVHCIRIKCLCFFLWIILPHSKLFLCTKTMI